MSAILNNKVDRDDLLDYIEDLSNQSKDGKFELSTSLLAKRYDVKAPTMDYHINRLINEGYLHVLPEKGKYNRRIFTFTPPERTVQQIFNPEEQEHFKKMLEEKLKIKPKEQTEEPSEIVEEEKLEEENFEDLSSFEDEMFSEDIADFPEDIKERALEQKELTLDEKIERYLSQVENIVSANQLITKEDKEILSVINESIQQNIAYLKNISNQLTTVQNKDLIQNLFDERNENQEKIEALQRENQALRHQIYETKGKFDIDPERVRFMHQHIIATIDSFLDQPNASLALGRRDFRKNVSKELSDLIRYVLNLEK